MDFLSKIFKQTKSGSGPSVGNKAPNQSLKSEHETYVEFAREFVDELVENLPNSSGKNIQPTKLFDIEDSTSVTSIVLSEKSCDTLPDLLQPESVYKKQTDTDTDTSHTTEYESALETDVQDSSSLNDGLLSDEIFDAAENSLADQQVKCQQGEQVDNSLEVHIVQKGDDVSSIVNVDGSLETLSCKHIERNSGEGSILMPLEVCSKSDLLSDCVKAGESAYITTTLAPGDITLLCADLANLDLDASTEFASVSVLNDLEISNQSASEIVADNSLDSCELDTIHLVETEEHELSVLVLDKTEDICAIPELHNLLIDADPFIQNTDYHVDGLTLQNCNTFQDDNRNTALHILPNVIEVGAVRKGSEALACENTQTCEAVKLPALESTFEAVKLSPEEINPTAEALAESVDFVKGPTFEVPSVKEDNINVEVNEENCFQELNITCEAQDKDAVNLTSDISNDSSAGISLSAVKDFNLSVEEFKDSLVKEINSTCNSGKELIDQVHTAIQEEEQIFVEKIKPTSLQNKTLVFGDSNLSCDFTESVVTELSFSEALTEPTVQVDKSTLETLKECTVEGTSLVVEQIKDTLEAISTSDAKNKPDFGVVEPEVNNVVADSYPCQENTETCQKQEGSSALALGEINVCGSSAETNNQVSLDITKDSSVSLSNLVDHEVIVEPLLCHELEKSNQETLVALVLPVIEEQKAPVQILEVVTANVEVGLITTVTSEHTDVPVQVNTEQTVDVAQITPPVNLLDFDNLAAEAVNVSNDFLSASQEVCEPDLIGLGQSETTVLLTKSMTMTDTGSTQRSDENVGSLPLDVKWLAESQNNSQRNRNSNVSSVKPADESPRLNNTSSLTDSRSSVIDCTTEDPFKRRSLLRNSPPRDMTRTDDNKCAIPSQPTIKMEKGAGESTDVKENHSEAGPDTAETFNIPGEEIFKDPSAFDFLSSMASTQPLRDYRKESLYVKFDPLVGSNPIAKTDKNIPLPPSFQENTRGGDTDLLTQVSGSPRHSTPVKNPAIDLIDRLISLSPSLKKPESPKPPPVVIQEPVHIPHSTREQDEMNEELHVLRELLDRQDKAHQEEIFKLKAEIETLQNKLNIIQQRNQEAEEREQKLNKKIIDKAQGQKQMSMIMEEYEKTISRLVAEKEAEHQAHELDKEAVVKEKDLALGHLTNIEIAFSDVHLKYERSKNVIEGFKKNEEVLRASLADYEATIHKQEQKYELLKSHAMQQLEGANQELESVRRSQQADNAKLRAMLKKSELKTSSLEEMLEQKIKENQELASICDDLISKVGN